LEAQVLPTCMCRALISGWKPANSDLEEAGAPNESAETMSADQRQNAAVDDDIQDATEAGDSIEVVADTGGIEEHQNGQKIKQVHMAQALSMMQMGLFCRWLGRHRCCHRRGRSPDIPKIRNGRRA